jgi:hypothetical protein
MCHRKICAMLPTKDATLYKKTPKNDGKGRKVEEMFIEIKNHMFYAQ